MGRLSARAHRAFEAEGRVHLADRAIGADREHALARAPLAVADRNVWARIADVVERAAVAPGRFDQCRLVAQPVVEARGDVEPGLDRRDGVADEVVAHLAPRIGDAEDERPGARGDRSEEHTTELQSLMRISYAVFCLKKKKTNNNKKEEHKT